MGNKSKALVAVERMMEVVKSVSETRCAEYTFLKGIFKDYNFTKPILSSAFKNVDKWLLLISHEIEVIERNPLDVIEEVCRIMRALEIMESYSEYELNIASEKLSGTFQPNFSNYIEDEEYHCG